MEGSISQFSGYVTSPAGFSAAAVASGLKKDGLDLALVYAEEDCTAAAMFTKNQVVAAPVIVDRETLQNNRSQLRVVVANSGNANACTGELGLANAWETQRLVAANVNCRPEQVLVLSTGVIGVQLPMERIRGGIKQAAAELSSKHGLEVARAIMTTDTMPKHLAVKVSLPVGTFVIGGMAKGAGMIHPDMATMLAVLTTDASVSPGLLDELLRKAVDVSFNRISIDGDTSTNDTVLLMANGASGLAIEGEDSITLFGRALTELCIQLAKMVVHDGEGASKFVEIRVVGCSREDDALAIARTIANSPLVKTAFAGSDANWGRILMAAGRAGVPFDQNKVNLWIGAKDATELQLLAHGTPTDYEEVDAAAIFAQPDFVVQLDIGAGTESATMWTSDLTHEYVTINADYRT